MAGYFISNNKVVFDRVVSEISDLFPRHESKVILGWHLTYFQKKNIENHQNCYEFADGFIIGVGTYFYRKRFGFEALKLVYQSLVRKENPFSDILGHFNFIIFQDGELSIITDKSGHYHALKAREDGSTCFSTSFMLLCMALKRLKLARQETLEFLNVAATFGGRTIVENIAHLKAGHIYKLDKHPSERKYYQMDDHKADFEEFVVRTRDYFDNLSNIGLPVACDLSAGYDTRATASVLIFNHTPLTFFSNKRQSYASMDLEIARTIAAITKLPLQEIDLDSQNEISDKLSYLVSATELSRGLDIARRQLSETINKSLRANMVISGWGAEMLRNQHGRMPSIDLNAEGFGYSRIAFPDKRMADQYHYELKRKFARDIEEAMGSMKTGIGERIYYLQRGRYWSASVLSVRNQYCYWLYPFFDHAIARYIFKFEKKNERFQKKFIDHFAPLLKKVPFWDAETVQAATLAGMTKKWIKKIVPSHFRYLKPLFKKKINKADFSDTDVELQQELTEWFGIDAAYLRRHKATRSLTKYQALSEFFGIFKDKVDLV